MTESCDADAAHVITHVLTRPAMEPDLASTQAIHEGLSAKGLLPAEHFVDAGYVDAALLVESRRDHGVSLEGPVRATAKRATPESQAFEQSHFAIDWEREQVTCPEGKQSVTWRTGRDDAGAPRITVVFSRTDCGACTVRRLWDCQEFCAGGHDDGKERTIAWLSTKSFWTSFWRDATLRTFLPVTGFSTI